MRNTDNKIMFDCFTSSHSVYFEEAFDSEFWKQYRGVVVNAHNSAGYGHFAIRKSHTIWFKLPGFIKKLFPYKWIMWKNEREKMISLYFNDYDRSVNIVAAMCNPSYRKLTFDKATYEDLKACIPAFLEHVGYKFATEIECGCLTLNFESVEPDTDLQKKG